MTKNFRKWIKGFTLVELVIVIAIVAILSVSAFLVVNKWLGKSRDARRLSDVSTIMRSVTIHETESGFVPRPSGKISTGTIEAPDGFKDFSYVGTFGNSVSLVVKNISNVPTDPLIKGQEYIYGVSRNKKEFEVATTLEGNKYSTYLNSVLAINEKALVDGDYDPKTVILKGNILKVIPSFLFLTYTGVNLYDLGGSGVDYIVNNGNNKPYTINGEELSEDSQDESLARAVGNVNAKFDGIDLENESIDSIIDGVRDLSSGEDQMKEILSFAIEYVNSSPEIEGTPLSSYNSVNDLEEKIQISILGYTFEQPTPTYGGTGGGSSYYAGWKLDSGDWTACNVQTSVPECNHQIDCNCGGVNYCGVYSNGQQTYYCPGGNLEIITCEAKTSPLSCGGGSIPNSRLNSSFKGDNTTGRSYLNGTYAKSCLGYKNSGAYQSGVYWIDPYSSIDDYSVDTETVMLIKSNEYNGTTSFVDSAKGKSISRIGNTNHSSNTSAYGISSIYFDGDGDSLRLSDSTDWNMGNGSFTIDFWINTSQTTTGTLVRQYPVDNGNGWYISINDNGNDLYAFLGNAGSSKNMQITADVNNGQWHHIALTNDGSNVRVFVDGVKKDDRSIGFSMGDVSGDLFIGNSLGGLSDFEGYLDNIRITDGVALWTSDFTPPYRPMKAYCDMITDGGGWTMVLNYLHAGGDIGASNPNPGLNIRNISLPLYGDNELGKNESNTQYRGHASNNLFNSFGQINDVRFYCKTNHHPRIIHFKTTEQTLIDYFKTGNGRSNNFKNNFTPFSNHTGRLPLYTDRNEDNYGDRAMTEFPFYNDGDYHWSVRGRNTRRECDDFTRDLSVSDYYYSTHHQIYIR